MGRSSFLPSKYSNYPHRTLQYHDCRRGDGHRVALGARGIIDYGIFNAMIIQFGLDIPLLQYPITISLGKFAVELKNRSRTDDYGGIKDYSLE